MHGEACERYQSPIVVLSCGIFTIRSIDGGDDITHPYSLKK